jgi:hypothetical protein
MLAKRAIEQGKAKVSQENPVNFFAFQGNRVDARREDELAQSSKIKQMMKKFEQMPHLLNSINSNQTLCLNEGGTGCSYLPSRLGKDKGVEMLAAMRDILVNARGKIDNGRKCSKVQVNDVVDTVLQNVKRAHNKLVFDCPPQPAEGGKFTAREVDLGNGVKRVKF